jgi:ArsR family transcriptional regulator, arsenate/arsenite/antimonite-responsive transcriptional repressor / arsenate reductase (thioredoxin)
MYFAVMATVGAGLPPGFLRLAGHPVRWRLLTELARSDHQVRELRDLTGCPQNLVSYHLGRLRSAGLVSARRSSADGRDTYYRADLTRCGELLNEASQALHPGIGLVKAPLPTRDGPLLARDAALPARVLFLCTGNSGRSQMAEALLWHLSGGTVKAVSAGSHPRTLSPDAIAVMREHGIDISGQQPKHLDTFAGRRFGYVISLCDKVREVCPEFPGAPETIHWSMADPGAEGDGAERYQAYRRTADELRTRIGFLLARPGLLAQAPV